MTPVFCTNLSILSLRAEGIHRPIGLDGGDHIVVAVQYDHRPILVHSGPLRDDHGALRGTFLEDAHALEAGDGLQPRNQVLCALLVGAGGRSRRRHGWVTDYGPAEGACIVREFPMAG